MVLSDTMGPCSLVLKHHPLPKIPSNRRIDTFEWGYSFLSKANFHKNELPQTQ